MARIAGIETAGLGLARARRPAVDRLAGCRVLVLEDEYFLANDLAEDLKAHGARVIGPFAELSEANDQVANGGFDVAVLDIDVRGEKAFSLADELVRRRIPFVFATGYSPEVLPVRFRGARQLEKPVKLPELIEEIRQLCGRKGD